MRFNDKKNITSFEIVTLRISGMRYVCEYEIVMKDAEAEVSEYGIRFINSEDKRVLERRTVISEQEALNLLNECHVLSWNGFFGSHPRGVKDGTMFAFKAVVNDGRIITADGSQNFPKHYRDFTDGLYEILRQE